MSQTSLHKFFELLKLFDTEQRQIISTWRATLHFQKDNPFIQPEELEKYLRSYEELKLLKLLKRGKNSLWQVNLPYIEPTDNIYEVANEAVPTGSLCYSSALEILKLTDQRSNNTHIYNPRLKVDMFPQLEESLITQVVPPGTNLNQWQLNKIPYILKLDDIWDKYSLESHTVKEEWLFGTKIQEVQGVKVRVTDLERTLLDGLRNPKYCGGLTEVFRSWVRCINEIDLDKLIVYTESFESSILYQRTGFVLETLGLKHKVLDYWKINFTPRGGSRLLNPYKEYSSNYSNEWNISLNHPISILKNKDADYS